ncbi:MAG: homoserine O-succinyltransferase [Hyphomicrobiales bacterium]|nr:homoserine O-succinyltransferase [Hyphomicrobiales bacterium]
MTRLLAEAPRAPATPAPMEGAAPVEVALVVNMPDGAMEATERQFTRALAQAAGGRPLRIGLYHLPGVPRGEIAQARIAARYRPFEDLFEAPPDGLIVTGAEPKSARLDSEPYFPALARLADWAKDAVPAVAWSCLAAHAAVLHLDGIQRRPLSAKRTGMFAIKPTGRHPLVARLPPAARVAHSRWNDLDGEELSARGYVPLTTAGAAGVDSFVKAYRSTFLFFQGHPEYDALALAREYRRDVGRFLSGQAATYPVPPVDYFDRPTLGALALFEARAKAGLAKFDDFPPLGPPGPPSADANPTAIAFYRGWLGLVAERAAARH